MNNKYPVTGNSLLGPLRFGHRAVVGAHGKVYIQKHCWWGGWGKRQEIIPSTLVVTKTSQVVTS